MLKSQSISFQLFKILPIQKRMDLAQSPDAGASLLSALTPTQFAELFPKYYQRALPDVEGFQLAVTKRTREQQQKADGQLQERLASLESTNSELRQGMEKLGVARAKELPKLSPEQEAAYNTIRTADVPVNSEQGKMFASLDNEKLASVGITKTKNEKGEEVLHYTAPVSTREEAVSRLQTSGGSGASIGERLAFYRQYAASKGVDPDLVTGIVMREGGGTKNRMQRWANDDPSKSGKPGTAYGDFQLNVGTTVHRMGNDFLKKGIPMDSAHWKEQGMFAIDQIKNGRVHEWMSVKDNGGIERISQIGSNEWRTHASSATPTKPEGPNGQYSDKQIAEMISQLNQEKDAARRQQLANVLQGQGVQVPPGATSSGAARVPGSVIGGFYGESQQCVALSKHFAPQVGPASSWKINYDSSGSGIKPGSVIATTSYNDGSGGKMARTMPDHRSHYHTGIALSAPDAQGNVLILDQSAGRAAQIHKVNIHNYNGEKWGLVPGGQPTPRSMQAVHMAMGSANDIEKTAISDSLAGKAPTAQSTAPVQEVKQVTEATNTVPKTTEKQDPTPVSNAPAADAKQQAQEANKTAVVEKTEQAQPATQDTAKTAEVAKPAEKGPSSYMLNRNELISAIRNTDEFKNTFGSSLATDSMIYEGFFNDARTQKIMKDTGSTYDAASGTVKIGDYKKLQEAMPDMNVSKFLKPLKGAARGGNFNVPDGGLTAYRAMEGKDNTLVVDKNQKPLFTMNDKEAASFDPSQNKVKIDPSLKAKGDMRGQQPSQTTGDNSEVMNSINSLRNDMMARLNSTPAPTPMQIRPGMSDTGNMINNLHDMTRTPYLNPAFERAVRTANDGQPSNHFNFGNKNG